MLSVHNSHLFLKIMADARAHLAAGTFAEFYRAFIGNYVPSKKILEARKSADDERQASAGTNKLDKKQLCREVTLCYSRNHHEATKE